MTLKNFSHLSSQEWTIKSKQNQIILSNNQTSDEFIYEKITSNSWHLLEIYKERAQYTIPNTPQIILPCTQNDAHSVEMFVQTASFTLQKLIRKNSCDSYIQQLLKNVTKSVEYLVKKFGFFRFTKDMIKVTKNHNFLVWVHQNYNSTHRQYPFGTKNIYQDYKAMISDILGIFQEAGCKKQLEIIRSKVECERFISFEKLRIFIESYLRCVFKSAEKPKKLYHSPQFLKRRNSPNSNVQRSATINFSIIPKPMNQNPTRFVTSLTLCVATPVKSQSSNSHKEVSLCDNSDNQEDKIGSESFEKINNEMLNIFNSHGKQNLVSKTVSQTSQKMCSKQAELDQDSINMKKKDFRQSANSLATTGLLGSMASSGNLKFVSLDDQISSSTASLLNNDKKILASSAGVKQNKKIKQLKETFKIKASKIIEQNSQEINMPVSFIKSQKSNENMHRQSEMERDFDQLLVQQPSRHYRPSNDLLQLENQINNILLG